MGVNGVPVAPPPPVSRSGDGAWVLAVDGGGSKTDVVGLGARGEVLARVTGGTSNPQLVGVPVAAAVISRLAAEVVEAVGDRPLVQTSIYLAGMDTPEEIAAFHAAVADAAWLVGRPVIENDLFALLRAGTEEPDAAAVVVGTGMNAVAVRSDGASARFFALGDLSGDWGGGSTLGTEALWLAARAADGRGAATSLERLVPQALGCDTVEDVTLDLHFGRMPRTRVNELAPVLLAASAAGDAPARAIVDRQAAEVVAMASVALEKLGLAASAVPVVLGGGVIASQDARLMSGIRTGLAARVPNARLVLVTERPIVGAGLLALAAAGLPAA